MNLPEPVRTLGPADWLALAARTAHVPMGMSSLRTGLMVDANEAFCRLFRYTRQELIGRSPTQLGLWPRPEQRRRLVEQVQQQGHVTRFEARYRTQDGEEGDLEISAHLAQHEGEPLLVAFLTDVTDRLEFVEGLRVAQTRLGVVLRASDVLVFHQDTQLRYTWVANPALGATESELIGRTDDEIMGAAAAAPLVAIKSRVLTSGRAERRDVWVANGDQLGCFDLVVEPERDSTGRVVGIVCAALDITARMTAAAHLAAGPASTILGLSALVSHEPLSTGQARRLKRIHREAARLTAPVSQQPPRQQLRQRHGGAGVVVAEHNPVVRELLQAVLEDAGLRVLPVATGVEAFHAGLVEPVALVLLDMELPQAGGVSAARALRAMVPRPLPLVAMLSPGLGEQASRLLDAELDDVLEKPVAADALCEKVLTWLDRR